MSIDLTQTKNWYNKQKLYKKPVSISTLVLLGQKWKGKSYVTWYVEGSLRSPQPDGIRRGHPTKTTIVCKTKGSSLQRKSSPLLTLPSHLFHYF